MSSNPLTRGPSISGINLQREAISPSRVASLAGGTIDPNPHPDHVDHHDDHSAVHNEVSPPEGRMDRGMAKLWYYAGKAGQKVMGNLKKLETPLTVQAMVRADGQKLHLYHELDLDGQVRRSPKLNPEEELYLQNRLSLISQYRTLARFLGLPNADLGGELIHPDDIPIIALGGSDGGYKAYLGFSATFDVCKEVGLWDLLAYVGGVSTSCWALAAYMTWAERSTQTLLAQQSAISSQHPLAATAVDRVANSPYGSYYLFGPLLHKVNSGVPLGMLDIYSTFLTSYQWLAPPHDGIVDDPYPPFLDRQWFQWSKTFVRAGISEGNEPFPILTAVRDASRGDKSTSPAAQKGKATGTGEWFEFNPLEMGSDEIGAWIPTWAFGRRFYDGKTVARTPEQSLALVLGLCASSPAIPLSDYLTHIAQGLPQNIFGNSASNIANQPGNWTSGTAAGGPNHPHLHPTANEPNPFIQGTGEPDPNKSGTIEGGEYLYLTDAGFRHSFPTHSFLNANRNVDIIINCDFSDTAHSGVTPVEKIKEFGRERGVEFTPRNNRPPVQTGGKLSAEEIARRYEGRYADILDGKAVGADGKTKPVTMVYVPLLPNKVQPSYDPASAEFSNSFNLVWTPEQVNMITETQKADMKEAMASIKVVIREAYERKRAARLGLNQPQVQPQVQAQTSGSPMPPPQQSQPQPSSAGSTVASPASIPSSATSASGPRGALNSSSSSLDTAFAVPPPPAPTPVAGPGPAPPVDLPPPQSSFASSGGSTGEYPSEPPPAYDPSSQVQVAPEKATYRPSGDGSTGAGGSGGPA